MAIKTPPSRYLRNKNQSLNKKTKALKLYINQLLTNIDKTISGKGSLKLLLGRSKEDAFFLLYQVSEDLVKDIDRFLVEIDQLQKSYRRSRKLKHEFPTDFITNLTSTRNLKRKLLLLQGKGKMIAKEVSQMPEFKSPASTVSKFSKAQMMEMSPNKIKDQFGFDMGMAFFLWGSLMVMGSIKIIGNKIRSIKSEL